MNADDRKRFHAMTYGQQALQYFSKYQDDKAYRYLEQAQNWLEGEIRKGTADYMIKETIKSIREILNKA